MAKARNVVIVESPAKAKTIGKYLGGDYKVASSMGHVRDLPPKKLGIDIENGFQPTYELIKNRKDTVADLKKLTSKADTVYLATDLDREGEAIAWHLAEALEIPQDKLQRVTFNEITEKAIKEAFQHARQIDINKVDAQQARRLLDRIVGYQLSPLLWKKIARGLSAGRVQSVAVRLICEREKEITDFKPEEFWRVIAKLQPGDAKKDKDVFEAELKKIDGKDAGLTDEEQTTAAVEGLQSQPFAVSDIATKVQRPAPPPPFITSTLQQEASIQLRFSAKRTMMLAQQLYEGIELGAEGSAGLITYMRTDSVRISDDALNECRTLVEQVFGKEYLQPKPRFFKSGKRAQEAHEAIRPTSAMLKPDDIKAFLSRDQYKLYNLIWQRFVATQMANAKVELTDVSVCAANALFTAKGRRVLFDGYQKLSPSDTADQLLPALSVGQQLNLLELTPSQHFTKPPPRYTEASLVKALEKEGIGRPSTYATIISTIQQRGYVEQDQRKFQATELGMLVNERLVKHFSHILDLKFTSNMEEELDKIEEEHLNWVDVLGQFHSVFSDDLERAKDEMEKYLQLSDEKCEKCGQPMAIKFNARGKFLACTGFPECRNAKPIGEDAARPEPEATDYKCEKCDSPMVIRHGKMGPFMACSAFPKCRNTISIDKDGNPVKPEETEEKCEKCGSEMVVRSGRRGKFLACSAFPKCRNTKPLPKDANAEPPPPTGIECEECGKEMVIRSSRRGEFLACPGYPDCKNTVSMTDEIREQIAANAEEAGAKAESKGKTGGEAAQPQAGKTQAEPAEE